MLLAPSDIKYQHKNKFEQEKVECLKHIRKNNDIIPFLKYLENTNVIRAPSNEQ